MPLRRLAPLVLVGLTACFVDVGAGASSPDGSSTTPGTDSSTGPAETSADDAGEASDTKQATSQGPTTASASEAGTTDADPTTGGPDPTTATTNTSMTTDPSTTTPMTTDPVTTDEPGPICGNGVLETGEDCDDGNFSNLDDCLDTCIPANCFDGYINQGETDNDCGGPCPPCGPCRACDSDAGCAAGLSCMGGLCDEYHIVQFNYFTECGLNDDVFVSVDLGNYGGAWRVEALAGGGLIEQNSGWGWLANCTGFDLSGLGAPFEYATPEDAFAAIDPKAIVVDFAGGETRCGIAESNCDDNFGGSQLGFSHACN